MSKTRVFCSINGDYEMTPVIVIVREGISMADFLAKAAKKLKVPEEKKLTRCFYSSGEVIDDPFDMMPEDKLFLSFGEDFKAKGSGGILSGGLSAIAGGASSLYDKVSGFAKSKMSEEMKKKFEATEAAVSSKLTPALEKAKELSAPAIGRADAMLDKASDKFTEKKKEFMASDTGKFLKKKATEVREKFGKPAAKKAAALFVVASGEFKKLSAQGKEKMLPLKAYVDGVRAKMGKEWDEKYAPAVKEMYEEAKKRGKVTQEKLKENQKKLEAMWTAKVAPVLNEKLRQAKEAVSGREADGEGKNAGDAKGDAIGAAEDAASEPAASDAEAAGVDEDAAPAEDQPAIEEPEARSVI